MNNLTKKVVVSISSFLFLWENLIFCYLSVPQQTFGPQTTLKPIDVTEYSKPNKMIDIAPGRPIAAKDKYGNRLYFSPTGRLTLKINTDGTKIFSLSAKSKEYDKEWKLQQISEVKKGSNLVEIKNEKGEIIGYQELGLGGKVIKEYDKDMNLVRSYKYDKFGKNKIFVLDEGSQVKTIFDEKGRPVADVNFEGTEVSWYVYDENNIIRQKIGITDDITYYDEKGKMLYTKDQFGNVITRYYYTKDDEGNEVVEKSVDYLGNVTYYKNNKPHIVKDKNGKLIKEYQYDGSTLVYEFDHRNNTVTWYDIDGKPLYVSYDDIKVKEYIYNEGKLVGLWDYTTNSLSVIIHQQEVAKLFLKEKPDGKKISEWIEKGYLAKNYTEDMPIAKTKYINKLTQPNLSLCQPREKIVNLSKRKQSIGYYSKETDEFIPIEITYFDKNGLVKKKENLISGKTEEFDTKGKLSASYVKLVIEEDGVLKEKKYEAKIEYNKDGSYKITYPSVIDKDQNINTYEDKEIIPDAQTEFYSFDGRLLEVVSKTYFDGEYHLSKQVLIYDAAGSLVKKQLLTSGGKIISETYYKHNLEQFTLKYVYNEYEELLGSYVSSRNFYEGRKLIKSESYELVDLTRNETKLISTVYFDLHSRPQIVKDALDRIVQKYFYNDRNKKETIEVVITSDEDKEQQKLKIKIAAGGILLKEEYTYVDDKKQHTIKTYYHNGYEEYKAISYLSN
ncbi:MAG: hypothetical protein NZ928_05590 [Endomicrobia bacterium]|nr:hypothetical protein [Endomicrobiia bacterium]MDW8055770.1 hypothetical protein [Elusimicrobiota bacterium]